MARRRFRRRGGGKSKAIPLAPVLPVVILAIQDFQGTDTIAGKANRFLAHTTGYNVMAKSFDYKLAMPFWLGEVAGIVVHKVANKTINKYVRKLTMGYIVV